MSSDGSTQTPATQTVGHAELRAGDADRDRVAGVLSDALAAGYLSLAEFDERSDQVLRSRTHGELDAVQCDLPIARYASPPRVLQAPAPDRSAAQQAAAQMSDLAGARRGLRAHVGSYLGTMALLLGIWLVVGLTVGAWYFWPIWPMLGWGIGVVSHVVPVLAGTKSPCGSSREISAP